MAGDLAAACTQFEAAVLRQVLTAAGLSHVGVNRSADDDSGNDESRMGTSAFSGDVFGSLVTEVLAGTLAASGGLGLAAELERRLATPAAPHAAIRASR